MDLIERILGISQISRKARETDSAHDRETRRPGARTNQNSNFRAVMVPVQPLMDHSRYSQLETTISKVSWLLCFPALLVGGATDWETLGCIRGPNWGIYSGREGFQCRVAQFRFSPHQGRWWEKGERRVLGFLLVSVPNICTGSGERKRCPSCEMRSPVLSHTKGNGFSRSLVYRYILLTFPYF